MRFPFRRASRRPTPAAPAGPLAQFLARGHNLFGALTLAGEDVGRLIREETDPRVLSAALARARRVHDVRWMIEASRRLLEIRFQPEQALVQVRNLLGGHHYEEAATLFARIDPVAVSAGERLEVRARVGLALQDFDLVRNAISQPDVLGEHRTKALYGELLQHLLRAGDFSAASVELGLGRYDFPNDVAIAAGAIQYVASRDGPARAAHALGKMTDSIPARSLQRMTLEATLLLDRGRFRECFELTASHIRENPGRFALYPLAAEAARHCDSMDGFERLLEVGATLFPHALDLRIMQCGVAAEHSDFATAEAILPTILEQSDWAYRTAVLDIACQQPGIERALAAYEDCRAAGIRDGGPETTLANYFYYYHAGAGNLQRARNLITPLLPFRMTDTGFLRTYFRVLIGLGEEAECRRSFMLLPQGLRETAALEPFAAYFQQRDGDEQGARHSWRRHLVASAHPALNAPVSYPETVSLRYEERSSDILAVLTVFNGIEYVRWFLDYYRALGVSHFFVTDNGSDDGTFELLLQQPDVSLFQNSSSFARSGFGVVWANHLLRRFGVGHWCFHVDMDEAFVFPGMDEGRRLSELVAYLDARGFASVPSVMVDIYPERLADGGSDFARSVFIDTDYLSIPAEIPPYRFVQGGIRSRLAGRSLLMTKAPLVHMQPDLCYLATNHQHTHVPVSDVTAALLHYKFIGKALVRFEEAIVRNEHFMGARFYRSLSEPLRSSASDGLLTPYSVRYEGPQHLTALGLMLSSNEWDQFGSQPSP